MKTVSVILARGGSKGIPGKNIMEIFGKPLIWYAINTSQKSKVNETWVSTDDEGIKTVAKTYSCNIINRPAELASDTSQSEEALLHFAENVEFDTLVFIQPTSPLLTPEDINSGLKMLNEYDSVFSTYREHWVPRWTLDGHPCEWDHKNRPMRQDKKEMFVENGAFYITSKKQLLKTKLRYSGKIGIYEMPFARSFQIDTLEDVNIVKRMLA